MTKIERVATAVI
jgi:hypothetical protein